MGWKIGSGRARRGRGSGRVENQIFQQAKHGDCCQLEKRSVEFYCWVHVTHMLLELGESSIQFWHFKEFLKTSNLLLNYDQNSVWKSPKKYHFHLEASSLILGELGFNCEGDESRLFLVIFKYCVTRTRNASFFMELLDDLHPQLSSFVFVSPGPDVKL